MTSAYFFFGICARGLLYLDPHIDVQPAFDPHRPPSRHKEEVVVVPESESLLSLAAAGKVEVEGEMSPETPRINKSNESIHHIADEEAEDRSEALGEASENRNGKSRLIRRSGSCGEVSTILRDYDGPESLAVVVGSSYDQQGYRNYSFSDCPYSSDLSSSKSKAAAGLPVSFNNDEYEYCTLPYENQFFPVVEKYPAVLPWSSVNPSMALYFLCRVSKGRD